MELRYVIVRGRMRVVRPGRSVSAVQAEAQLPGSATLRDEPPDGPADPGTTRG
jgi:hypothetical protein